MRTIKTPLFYDFKAYSGPPLMNDDEQAILKYMKRQCCTAVMNFNPYHEGEILLGLDPDDDYPSLKKIGTNLLDDINFVINLRSATKKLDSVGENIQDLIKDFQKLLKKVSEYKVITPKNN